MAKPRYPSEKLDQYMLRLPDGMRDRIREEAEKNNRSMNAEIISRLEASFGMDIPLVQGMVGTVQGLQAAARQISAALENPEFQAVLKQISKQADTPTKADD